MSKATIHRRLSGKTEPALAALDTRMQLGPLPDSGVIRADVVALIGRFEHLVVDMMGMQIFGTLPVEEKRHPYLQDAFRDRVTAARRSGMRTIVERRVERGELRPDVGVETVVDLVAGVVLMRRIIERERSAGYSKRLIDTRWPTLGARRPEHSA